MWRPASRFLLLGARSQGARVPGWVAGVRATTTTAAQDPATTATSFPAGVWLPTYGGPAAPHRTLHTTAAAASDAHSSTAVVEAEVDRLYSGLEVECRGHDPAVLRSYQKFVSTTAFHLDIPLEEIEWPKKHLQRWTVLKSVHIHKKHRVQYEARTHFLVIKFSRLTGSTADTFLEYIQRNLPEGVAMKVTTHELQKLPPHVKPSCVVVV